MPHRSRTSDQRASTLKAPFGLIRWGLVSYVLSNNTRDDHPRALFGPRFAGAPRCFFPHGGPPGFDPPPPPAEWPNRRGGSWGQGLSLSTPRGFPSRPVT